jgi:hypothetical protein
MVPLRHQLTFVMRDHSSMRDRVAFLRAQAEEFRKRADGSADVLLQSRFLDLAERCLNIAINIESNLPIHEGSDRLSV